MLIPRVPRSQPPKGSESRIGRGVAGLHRPFSPSSHRKAYLSTTIHKRTIADAVLNQLAASTLFDLTGGGAGIGTTLLANCATVYIMGPKQADLDRVAEIYSDAAEKSGKPGRMYGVEGNVKLKVCGPLR
ncbi:hypothetical protein BD413DRAFT_247575 [Trametes elegans]|nr:hypothetical protein BD413DRAFT_247575 [Trametes elegans]